MATRHAIYERARKAQQALLRTLGPPLPESVIAREEKALDEAIALVEAKFGGMDSTVEPPFAAADAARTEASTPPLSNLAKVVPPSARADKSNSWFWLPLAAVLGATRHAIYERARKAQLALLRTLGPSLTESVIAREEKALDEAIALVEAKFSGIELHGGDAFRCGGGCGTNRGLDSASVQPRQGRSTKRARQQKQLVVLASARRCLRRCPRGRGCHDHGASEFAIPRRRSAGRAEGTRAAAAGENRSAAATLGYGGKFDRARGERAAGKSPHRAKRSGAGQSSAGSSPALLGTARGAMLIASNDPQQPVVSLGSTVWSAIPPAPGHPSTLAVKADANIPDLKMHATMTLRKNTDPTLQATHTIDLKFSFAEGAPITGVKNVEPKMRNLGSTASEALTSADLKISDFYFVIALANRDPDRAHNLDLIQTRAWFEFPMLLNDNRIAKLLFQKSPGAEAMLAKAFEAWNE